MRANLMQKFCALCVLVLFGSYSFADPITNAPPAFASSEYPLQPEQISTRTPEVEAVTTPTQAVSIEQPYLLDRQRGWWWYEDPEVVLPKKPQSEAKNQPKPQKPKTLEEMTAPEIRAEQQRLLEAATVNPTEANVKRYLEAQQFAFNKASIFADTWKRVVWKTPELNPAIKSPYATAGMNTKDSIDSQKRVKTVHELAQRYGIFFFFKSDCPYCHTMGPSLKHFSEKYGIEIFPVSIDGGSLPDFPKPEINNGIAEKLEVTTVPAMFLGDRETSDIIPVGYGVIAESELLDRIYILTQTKPGEN